MKFLLVIRNTLLTTIEILFTVFPGLKQSNYSLFGDVPEGECCLYIKDFYLFAIFNSMILNDFTV